MTASTLKVRAAGRPLLALLACLVLAPAASGHDPNGEHHHHGKPPFNDKFRQIEGRFPTPTEARIASGAPGPAYWQQKVDYVIHVELDEKNHRVTGSETVTYHNRSPHTLGYLWLQLDNNIFAPHSESNVTRTSSESGLSRVSDKSLERMLAAEEFDGSVKIGSVKAADGSDLNHSVVDTMMRVDLKEPLKPEESVTFSVEWRYTINDSDLVSARTGLEHFEEDGNTLYEMAHWYPRLACYMDYSGWQNKQFLGAGEFTLEMGDFEVHITVPADHVVAATGVLQNPEEVLTEEQRYRLEQAKKASTPMFVVTPEEAKENEKEKSANRKTWVYKAERVRDFAFATSRKFIWDAMGQKLGDKTVLCMSYYPNEGEPLWSKYSTHAVAHTVEVYSKFTFDYPYPVAISVNGPVGGMEYPMICFNGPRPEKDGTYSARTKYGLISVIIHEVGHNWFPMIVNSDERQWTWMDEGLNTFLQYLTEQEWEEDYPSRSGEPQKIVSYMASDSQSPIMTNSDSVLRLGPNAYAKPATALNILRETVLGREQFDFAFKEYANRWKFKHPTPSDFFRTMEDASGRDLDWFWSGWFYTTDHVDIDLESVRHVRMSEADPEAKKARQREERDAEPETLSQSRNKELTKRVDTFPELSDFYNEYDELDVTEAEKKAYAKQLEKLSEETAKLIEKGDRNYYFLTFRNLGGLVSPLIVEMHFEDGSTEEVRIPAEVWRRNAEKVTKMIPTAKPVVRFVLDPHLETADTDLANNQFPRKPAESRFDVYEYKRPTSKNPMQKERDAKKAAEKAKEKAGEKEGEKSEKPESDEKSEEAKSEDAKDKSSDDKPEPKKEKAAAKESEASKPKDDKKPAESDES